MTTMTIIDDGDDDDDDDEDDRNNDNNYVETNRRLWELKIRDYVISINEDVRQCR